jgi:hypothetical protein
MTSLQDLFDKAQRTAELNVAERGGFNCFFFIETGNGATAILEAPIRHADNVDLTEGKKLWARSMREVFEQMGVTRFACANEIWMGSPTWSDAPRKDPQRREGILIFAWDGARAIAGARTIERPHGRPPHLGKLEMQPVEPPNSGSLFDLLPGRLRWSCELPDDEEEVFLTCVPEAPFQVLGRVGEHDGRLYIGSVVPRKTNARELSKQELATQLAAANMSIRLLDGPGAVELIADIQTKRPDLVAKAKEVADLRGRPLQ